jgi:hypothetical protein
MPEPQPSPGSQNPNPQSGQQAQAPWIASVQGVRDEYKTLPSLTSYKDINGLLSSHVALEKRLGSSVLIPGPEASDEDRGKFYTKLGRPESPDKYTFNAKEITEAALGKDFPVNEEFLKSARAAFHAHGVTDAQAKELVSMYVGAQKQAIDAMNAEMEQEVGKLKSEWGHAYDSNVALATRAVGVLAEDIPELGKFFEDPKNGSNPTMLKLFAFLGKAMGEDTAVTGAQTLPEQAQKDIKTQLDNMMTNPENPDYKAIHDENHPGHKAANEKRRALYQQLYPSNQNGAAA